MGKLANLEGKKSRFLNDLAEIVYVLDNTSLKVNRAEGQPAWQP
jgi:hypothetical protein